MYIVVMALMHMYGIFLQCVHIRAGHSSTLPSNDAGLEIFEHNQVSFFWTIHNQVSSFTHCTAISVASSSHLQILQATQQDKTSQVYS